MTASLNALHAFLAVARCGGFSAAARELGVSASALSQAVKRLEGQLDVVLLQRTSRSMSLTDAGRRLVDRAGPAVERALGAIEQASARLDEVVGTVRLSVPTVSAPMVLEQVVPVFALRHPKVTLDIRVENAFVDIAAAGLDAGIRLHHALERDMVHVRLHGPCRVVVAGSPAYLARHGEPSVPADLLRHRCIGLRFADDASPYVWRLGEGDEQQKIPVRGPVITGDRYLARQLAVDGVGLHFGLDAFIRGELERGELRLVLEPYARQVEGMFLYFPSRAQVSPALRAFIDTARDVVGTV